MTNNIRPTSTVGVRQGVAPAAPAATPAPAGVILFGAAANGGILHIHGGGVFHLGPPVVKGIMMPGNGALAAPVDILGAGDGPGDDA